MQLIDKIKAKAKDNKNNGAVTIAFLGTSVTQGCFEVYIDVTGDLETTFDMKCAYHKYIADIFAMLYPSVPVNIINAGISGDTAPHGYERLEKDVLSYNPDLVVVCFGLNDSMGKMEGLEKYTIALDNIFKKLIKSGKEVIFMTPNMMNTSISPHIDNEAIKNVALTTKEIQESGILDIYINAAKAVCAENNIQVCDCYERWKKLYENGVNITELLSNKINHPTREMHWLFAISLVETIMGM